MLLCDIIMGNPQVPVALGIGRYQLIHPLPARLKGGPLHAKGLQLLNLQGRELIAVVGLPLGMEPAGQINPGGTGQIGGDREGTVSTVITINRLIALIQAWP